MNYKPLIKRTPLLAAGILTFYGIRYCWFSFPIATGYGAKVLCSALFLSGRKEKDILAEDLHFFPLNLITYTVNYEEQSVTCSLLGCAHRKAIYREGYGATLLSDLSGKELRTQHLPKINTPAISRLTVAEPAGEKLPEDDPENMDKAKLDRVIESEFDTRANPSLGTRAIVVLYDGKWVAERYAPGFSKDTPLAGWSMAKSITSALIGLLVRQQQLDIEAPAPVPEWQGKNDPRRFITTKDLLQQCSGLDFEEEYTRRSHVTQMLYQQDDMAAYAASRPLKYPPGTFFYYSSGNTNILAGIIRRLVGEESYAAFPYTHFLHKIGMHQTILEPDASGTFVGSSYCYATARDWARFGLLYLQEGMCNNERLLPAAWIRQTLKPAPAAPLGEYGFQFWLNAGQKGNPAKRLHPGLPTDLFYARGYEGQSLFILPSKKLVVVRLGLTKNDAFNTDLFLQKIIQTID